MASQPSLAELDQLRRTLCDNTARIDDVQFLHALRLLQEAWLAQAAHRPDRRARLAVRLPLPPRIVAWLGVFPYLSG